MERGLRYRLKEEPSSLFGLSSASLCSLFCSESWEIVSFVYSSLKGKPWFSRQCDDSWPPFLSSHLDFGENFKSALNRASTERASKGAARIRNLNKKKKRKKGRDGSDISESSRGEEEKRQSGDGDEEEEGKVENKNGTRSETDTRKLDQDLDLEKGDSKNEEKEQDPQKESSSQRSSSSSKRSKKYSPADIPVENLPIQLARSASMFHHYASQYMETHQEALVELVWVRSNQMRGLQKDITSLVHD